MAEAIKDELHRSYLDDYYCIYRRFRKTKSI